MKRTLLALSLTLSAVACKADPTQLVVVVGSDLKIPEELSSIRVKIFNAGQALPMETLRLTGPGAIQLPFSFGVAPPGAGREDPVDITLSAIRADDSVGVEQHRATHLRAHKTLLLPMLLLGRCAGACEVGQSCDASGCSSPNVDPNALQEVEPGNELEAGMVPPASDAAITDAPSLDGG